VRLQGDYEHITLRHYSHICLLTVRLQADRKHVTLWLFIRTNLCYCSEISSRLYFPVCNEITGRNHTHHYLFLFALSVLTFAFYAVTPKADLNSYNLATFLHWASDRPFIANSSHFSTAGSHDLISTDKHYISTKIFREFVVLTRIFLCFHKMFNYCLIALF
jgi:hypothetical protein